ncbi:MAG: hypothetical protein CVV44_05785 [Spirochaetae bacterium HGW-Spirochaetae-1]|jgi:tetratricopeptide (TPR) repeat protein|nr:MAG: hypothetical protein CVV44_05785 [Spirochaetae bacterium HGW-Spirochaetae-1]
MNSISVPTEAVTIYNNALELSTRGDLATALAEYRRAIDIYPGFVEAYNNIGEIHSGMGNSDLAVSAYLQALTIEKHYRVLLNIGVEYYNSGRPEKALQYFLDSLTMKPDFLEGNYYAGLIFYDDKKYKEAETYLGRVINIDMKHMKANYILSYIYYEWKQYEKVLACLDNIKDTADDKSFIKKYYGFCCYYLGRFTEAVDYLTEALESQPRYAKFKTYLQNLTYESKVKEVGDVEKAIKELEKNMLGERPAVSEISRLSMLYIFKGQNKKAEKLLMNYKAKIAS